MRYMLLIYGCERTGAGTPRSTAKRAAVRDWLTDLTREGVLLAADPLHDTATATTVRVRGDEALVTDGPFAETAEQLGGYAVLECPDLDTALGHAAACPMAVEGSVEVRPILEIVSELGIGPGTD